MEDLIQINWNSVNDISVEEKEKKDNLIKVIEEKISSFVQETKKGKLWDNSIKKIIITDKYEEEIAKQANEWGISFVLTSEKEYLGFSKILFNRNYSNPINYIYFKIDVIQFPAIPELSNMFEQAFIGQFIKVFSHNILPNSLKEYEFNKPLKTFEDYLYHILTIWLPLNYANKIEKQVFSNEKKNFNTNKTINAFLRQLKSNLFEYNSDEKDIYKFWNKTFRSFSYLISRMIDIYHFDNNLIFKNKEYQSLIEPIISELVNITDKLEVNKEFDILGIKKEILSFLTFFDIHITEYTSNFYINLIKNPKDYFVETLVDTEPRFVCFLDIIGFKEMIKKYDTDYTSSILQDIQEAFSETIGMLENEYFQKDDLLSHLKYQMFSDNVSISIPYFDNKEDFLTNFNLISIFIRGLQFLMMAKGFFIRGGLSIGSYYSDKNMIFSQGLVNAYELETKKAIYPRVIVDKIILDKFEKYGNNELEKYGIKKYLISDWENMVFLNPFNLTANLISQFEDANSMVKLEDDDELSRTINNFLDLSFSIAKPYYEKIQSSTPEIINDIKNHIENNKRANFNNEYVLSKYIWIEELMKWLENENSSNLKFNYLYKKTNA